MSTGWTIARLDRACERLKTEKARIARHIARLQEEITTLLAIDSPVANLRVSLADLTVVAKRDRAVDALLERLYNEYDVLLDAEQGTDYADDGLLPITPEELAAFRCTPEDVGAFDREWLHL